MNPRDPAAKLVQLHLYAPDIPTRMQAADYLYNAGSVEDALTLLEELGARNRYVATRAAWGLTMLSPDVALPYLARALDDLEPAVVERAAWALGRIDDPRARKILVVGLSHHRAEIRQSAAGGLWRPACEGYSSEEAIEALRKMAGKDNGIAAIVLGYMLRTKALPERVERPAQDSVFARAGGHWIR